MKSRPKNNPQRFLQRIKKPEIRIGLKEPNSGKTRFGVYPLIVRSSDAKRKIDAEKKRLAERARHETLEQLISRSSSIARREKKFSHKIYVSFFKGRRESDWAQLIRQIRAHGFEAKKVKMGKGYPGQRLDESYLRVYKGNRRISYLELQALLRKIAQEKSHTKRNQ